MIIGECPYDGCGETMVNYICDDPPKFERTTCESCGRVVWLYHSRLVPIAYTEESFLEIYEVDEETKALKEDRKPDTAIVVNELPGKLFGATHIKIDDELIEITKESDRH